MSKPDVVEVIRFYRPLTSIGYQLVIDSNRGVTAIFNLDYVNKKATAKVAVCVADNFSKRDGVEHARDHGRVFEIELPDEDNSLFQRLFQAAEKAWDEKKDRQFLRVLFPQLLHCSQGQITSVWHYTMPYNSFNIIGGSRV